LFCKTNNKNDRFHFVKGTKGQVWSLFEYNGTLFVVMIRVLLLLKMKQQDVFFHNQELGNFVKFPIKRYTSARKLLWNICAAKRSGTMGFKTKCLDLIILPNILKYQIPMIFM